MTNVKRLIGAHKYEFQMPAGSIAFYSAEPDQEITFERALWMLEVLKQYLLQQESDSVQPPNGCPL